MSKKIVIDKEQIDFVTLKKLRRYFGDNDKTLFEQRMYNFIGKLIETFDSATEIDVDQSIDVRAKKYAENKSSSDVFKESHINDYIKGATEQDLISKAREKEFSVGDLIKWKESDGIMYYGIIDHVYDKYCEVSYGSKSKLRRFLRRECNLDYFCDVDKRVLINITKKELDN